MIGLQRTIKAVANCRLSKRAWCRQLSHAGAKAVQRLIGPDAARIRGTGRQGRKLVASHGQKRIRHNPIMWTMNGLIRHDATNGLVHHLNR